MRNSNGSVWRKDGHECVSLKPQKMWFEWNETVKKTPKSRKKTNNLALGPSYAKKERSYFALSSIEPFKLVSWKFNDAIFLYSLLAARAAGTASRPFAQKYSAISSKLFSTAYMNNSCMHPVQEVRKVGHLVQSVLSCTNFQLIFYLLKTFIHLTLVG